MNIQMNFLSRVVKASHMVSSALEMPKAISILPRSSISSALELKQEDMFHVF